MKHANLQTMTSTDLGMLNQQCDEIMNLLGVEYTEPRIELYSKLVDTSTTEDECHKNFINMIRFKELDVEDAISKYFDKMHPSDILFMLRKSMQ